jgi:hypothetical protein
MGPGPFVERRRITRMNRDDPRAGRHERRFGVELIRELPEGEHAVRVETIYQLRGGGYVWVMTHRDTGERIEAAAPLLAVIDSDIGERASDLQQVHGVKVPLPGPTARALGEDTAMLLPWQLFLFDRECTLVVEGPEDPSTAFVVTRDL